MRTCSFGESNTARRERAWLIDVSALALLLFLAGVLLAVPGRQWAEFGLGLGAILLGKNLVRFLNGLRMRRIGLAAGGGALAAGLAGLASPESPLLGIFLIATGVFALALALWGFTTRR